MKALVLAYIDPGSGSYFFQLLVAGLFAAIFTSKTLWVKIRDFFGRIFKKRNKKNGY